MPVVYQIKVHMLKAIEIQLKFNLSMNIFKSSNMENCFHLFKTLLKHHIHIFLRSLKSNLKTKINFLWEQEFAFIGAVLTIVCSRVPLKIWMTLSWTRNPWFKFFWMTEIEDKWKYQASECYLKITPMSVSIIFRKILFVIDISYFFVHY